MGVKGLPVSVTLKMTCETTHVRITPLSFGIRNGTQCTTQVGDCIILIYVRNAFTDRKVCYSASVGPHSKLSEHSMYLETKRSDVLNTINTVAYVAESFLMTLFSEPLGGVMGLSHEHSFLEMV